MDIQTHADLELPRVPQRYLSKTLLYRSELQLPYPPAELFDFFSQVENLDLVTPSWFAFSVKSALPIQIESGREIHYTLRWRRLPLRWTSRIVEHNPPRDFSYEQGQGPYRAFYHDHTYLPNAEGTLAVDRVFYRVWGGRIVDTLFVRKDLHRIFEFRKKRSLQLLPDWIAQRERAPRSSSPQVSTSVASQSARPTAHSNRSD